jgi:hypothetical protein
MLETNLLLSLFPDLQRVFGDRNPLREKNKRFLLSLFELTDQLNQMGQPVPESILLALFLTPLLSAVTPEHPFLGEKERAIYLGQTIRLLLYQVLTPFSVPKALKETVYQILMAQSYLRKAVQRGGIPRRMRMKKYFKEGVLLFGIEAQAKGKKVPFLLRSAVPSGLLPWWPKEFRRRRKFRRSEQQEG